MRKARFAKKGADASAAAKLKLPDFSRSLPMLLLRSREAVMRYFRPSLLEHGVTEQQWRVLRALSSVDEMEVMMLADATYLLAPSMSRILKDLHKRGLLTRRSDKRDLRRNLVAISPKGNDLINTLSPRSEAAYTEIAARFGSTNFEQLGNLLLKLEAELQKHAPGNGGSGAPPSRSRHRTPRVAR
jgi:homoprotocatechuate degradation regulator HpaR